VEVSQGAEEFHGRKKVEGLKKIFADIIKDGHKEEDEDGEQLVGLLSCMSRDEAADAQAEIVDERNKENLRWMQEALFLVCLDEADHEVLEDKERDRLRFNFLPRGSSEKQLRYCNRWFEKAFQIIVPIHDHEDGTSSSSSATAPSPMALNFEHSFIDSSASHKFCSFLHRRAREMLTSTDTHGDTKEGASVGGSSFAYQRIRWHMETSLKRAIDAASIAALESNARLLPCCLDYVMAGIGRSSFKRVKCSPDGCFQIGMLLLVFSFFSLLLCIMHIALQLALCSMKGERVYCLETVDIRHYEDGR